MAKVTDIQDMNGVSKEIQDKDLANRTSQSSIASSDYVLLEDTNGAYHKISKASFTEAVRGALGSVINSVAKGTDIAKLPVLDSNNDLGMGTLANVASVLGVIQEYDTLLDERYDLNDFRQNYIALHPKDASVPTNTPFATGDYIFVSLKDNKGFGIKRILQIAFSATVGIAYRIIQDNETPPSWNKINLTT